MHCWSWWYCPGFCDKTTKIHLKVIIIERGSLWAEYSTCWSFIWRKNEQSARCTKCSAVFGITHGCANDIHILDHIRSCHRNILKNLWELWYNNSGPTCRTAWNKKDQPNIMEIEDSSLFKCNIHLHFLWIWKRANPNGKSIDVTWRLSILFKFLETCSLLDTRGSCFVRTL